MRMKGLSFASIKKNPALLPLYFFIGVAATGATVFTLRMAFHATDVSWVNKKDAEPWNYYKDKPYKFYVSKNEYKTVKSQAPEY
ncbi:cytochrome c oxidase subunit NDUFA4 isoform X3 [Monomorium pharaonis]|uniref:cytochrome c oxidase subunit NDUFA4 isoform X3 n=1 Tax=Monomorium pharaonis TaxID=307658 RepID=UPI00102E1407|nr:cytochrome c oxidase subunit NDUFA4 isoform X3 [Monomorium pharaonis]